MGVDTEWGELADRHDRAVAAAVANRACRGREGSRPAGILLAPPAVLQLAVRAEQQAHVDEDENPSTSTSSSSCDSSMREGKPPNTTSKGIISAWVIDCSQPTPELRALVHWLLYGHTTDTDTDTVTSGAAEADVAAPADTQQQAVALEDLAKLDMRAVAPSGSGEGASSALPPPPFRDPPFRDPRPILVGFAFAHDIPRLRCLATGDGFAPTKTVTHSATLQLDEPKQDIYGSAGSAKGGDGN